MGNQNHRSGSGGHTVVSLASKVADAAAKAAKKLATKKRR